MTEADEEWQAAMIRQQWRSESQQESQPVTVAVRLRHLLAFHSYAFEALGAGRTLALLMGDAGSVATVELDRIGRNLRCEMRDMIDGGGR